MVPVGNVVDRMVTLANEVLDGVEVMRDGEGCSVGRMRSDKSGAGSRSKISLGVSEIRMKL